MHAWRTLTVALALGIACTSAMAREDLDLSLPELGDPADRAMTAAEEERLGAEMLRQLSGRTTLSDDPAVVGYVRDLGKRLAGHSGDGQRYTFFVVENPRINAFAMPGGYIGVHTGLITSARRESELAGVMAHEMAHVTQRHLARRLIANEGITLRTAAMVLAGLIIGTQNPQAGAAATIGGMASSIQSQLAHSREHEREADRIGLRLLADARFDPQGMPDFFGRLMDANRYRREPPPFLSTHPLTVERISDSRSRAQEMSVDSVFESPDFALVRARLEARRTESAEEAVRYFREQIAARPEDPGVRYGLAMALLREGSVDAAEKHLSELQADSDDHALIYLGRAEVALEADRADRAVRILEEGLSLFPGDYALQYRRVDALLARGDAQRALQASAETVHAFPRDVALLEQRARVADAAGDRAEADLALARHSARLGDFEQALARVERVLEGGHADGYQRSRAQALQEQWRDALERRKADG